MIKKNIISDLIHNPRNISFNKREYLNFKKEYFKYFKSGFKFAKSNDLKDGDLICNFMGKEITFKE